MKVLVTGSSGLVGRYLAPALAQRHEVVGYDRRAGGADVPTVIGELGDLAALRAALDGAEVVVHLAATPGENGFVDNLVPNNIVGCYNVFEAAAAAGVRRVVYASSVHTIMRYPRERPVEIDDPVRPITLYGASKVFAEAAGRYYFERGCFEFVGVRIGWFLPDDDARLRRDRCARALWLSPRDGVDLFTRAVERPDLGFAVVFATSRNDPQWCSLRAARELLGYEPHDDIASIPAELAEEQPLDYHTRPRLEA